MTRSPQVLITYAPDGTLVAEHHRNGHRHHTPISSLTTIHRILASQLSQTPQTIGLDGAPTTAQTLHWEQHLDRNLTDPNCGWCLAASMGVDTSYAAFRRAKAILLADRNRARRKHDRTRHTVGDGSVRVRIIPKQSPHISHRLVSISDDPLFELDG